MNRLTLQRNSRGGEEPGAKSLLPEPQPQEYLLAPGRAHTSTLVAFPQRLNGFLGFSCLPADWPPDSQSRGAAISRQAQAGEKHHPPHSFHGQNRPRHPPAAALFLPREPDQTNHHSAVTIMMTVEHVDCLYPLLPPPTPPCDH